MALLTARVRAREPVHHILPPSGRGGVGIEGQPRTLDRLRQEVVQGCQDVAAGGVVALGELGGLLVVAPGTVAGGDHGGDQGSVVLVAVGVLGFGIMLRAWWLFRERATAICPTAKTTSLITNDVYGLTRNPMYLGIVMMLLGIAVATGSLPCYLASLAFFLIIDAVFCPYEERKLEQAFGDAFTRYRGAVRRWL